MKESEVQLGQIVWKCSDNVHLAASVYRGIVVRSESSDVSLQVRHIADFYGDRWTSTIAKDSRLTDWYLTCHEAIEACQSITKARAGRFALKLEHLGRSIGHKGSQHDSR